jgi:hypothetical protein
MSSDAPGPAPDQAAAEAAERELRAFAGTDPFRPLEVAAKVVLAELDRQREWIIELQRSEDELLHHKLWALREVSRLLAQLDRQRALIAAVLARCDEKEARSPHVVGGRLPAIIPVAEIRALLEGELR